MPNAPRYDFSKLNALAATLSDMKVTRVGVLGRKGQKARKNDPSTTNAEVGMAMEVGVRSKKVPARSWLRMPLSFQQSRILRETAKGAKELLIAGKKTPLMRRLGIAAEAAIQRAFNTGGFGKWEKLSPATIARKGSSAILIDTSQFRRAVSSDVVGKV